MKVVIVQRVVASYRVEFYTQLHAVLREAGVDLHIAAGQPWEDEAFVDSRSMVPNIHFLKNTRIFKKAYWQSGTFEVTRDADLVVFEQANSALINYGFILRRLLSGRKPFTAFWGHGAHLNKKNRHELRDRWKQFYILRVDHWFAYTALSQALVEGAGYPSAQITDVQNAIDTKDLRTARERLSEQDLAELFSDLFACPYDAAVKVGVYCARLTQLKNIPFLLEAAQLIRARIPEFRLIIIGDGVERERVARFVEQHSWCKWVGAKHGTERVPYLALGDIWLNPGMTGLSILDAFALGIPFATTDCGIHSPEIAYLRPNENGLLTGASVDAFADAVSDLLLSPDLPSYASAAASDGYKYSTESMVGNFARGILKVLEK